MEIKNIKLADLKPYENNPRNNDKSVDMVMRSIREFGFKVPIVVDQNNVIVAGHTRYKAVIKLGWDEVPCIVADDLSENQIKAFRIADNRVAEFSKWDVDKLFEEVDGLDEFIGFDDRDLEKLLKSNEEEIEGEVEFTEELNEENNYLVLFFDNSVDWLQVETFFDLKTVKALDSKKGFEKKGVGRVINGTKFMNKVLGNDH